MIPDSKKMHLSIIIPCYNEERNLRMGALQQVAHYLSKQQYAWEALIVDDGSTDESMQLVRNFCTEHTGFRLISRPHQGKGATVIAGIMAAKGEYILFTDLDQATPINQIEALMPFFNTSYEVVIGSRSSVRRGAPILRRTMARGFMLLRSLILDLEIRDTQCGFKAFSRRAAQQIFPKLRVFTLDGGQKKGSTVTAGFDVEMLYIAKRMGYKIAEVPVEWHYQETRHINPLKDSAEGLIDLLRIRWNSMRGVYGEENQNSKINPD